VFVAVSTTPREYNDGRHLVNVSKAEELTEIFIRHKLCQNGIRLRQSLRMSVELRIYCPLFLSCLIKTGVNGEILVDVCNTRHPEPR
jgi:hypothetical protein